MTAMPVGRQKRPPSFTTLVDTEVDIEPEELERAGWIYIGKEDKPPVTTARAVEVVERWHNEAHPGPWRWCREEPCHTLSAEDGAA